MIVLLVYLENDNTQLVDNQNNIKMKTRILSLITVLVAVLGFTTSTFAKDDNFTVLNDVKHINTLEIHGNVEVYVSDASSDQVKVYNKYYSESALVQSSNGVLRITSYKPEKLVVWVSANDLRSISAFDNAEVKSFGKLSKIELNVDLHDNAAAKLDVDAFSTNLIVKDFAKADISGSTEKYNLDRAALTAVNTSNFKAAQTTQNNVTLSADLNTDQIGM